MPEFRSCSSQAIIIYNYNQEKDMEIVLREIGGSIVECELNAANLEMLIAVPAIQKHHTDWMTLGDLGFKA